MRAAAADSRPMLLPFHTWTLRGGAYLDGDELALPAVGAVAESPLVWVRPFAVMRTATNVWSPEPGNRYLGTAYQQADRSTPGQNAGGTTGNGNAVAVPAGWSDQTSVGFQLGNQVTWMKMRLQITPAYGIPGQRHRFPPVTLIR